MEYFITDRSLDWAINCALSQVHRAINSRSVRVRNRAQKFLKLYPKQYVFASCWRSKRTFLWGLDHRASVKTNRGKTIPLLPIK